MRPLHTVVRTARGDDGSTIVELALCSVVLFALIFGVIEACLAFYTVHATNLAARQGVRWAMVRGSNSCNNTPSLTDCNATSANIQSHVATLGFLNLTTSDVAVNWLTASGTQPMTWSSCDPSTITCNLPGNEVQIIVTYPFSFDIPFVNSRSINISSTSTVVISQ